MDATREEDRLAFQPARACEDLGGWAVVTTDSDFRTRSSRRFPASNAFQGGCMVLALDRMSVTVPCLNAAPRAAGLSPLAATESTPSLAIVIPQWQRHDGWLDPFVRPTRAAV